jgi:AAA15 family ATPase/GTPase
MLLKFAITNYKSFKHQQTMDLVASARNEFPATLYTIDDNLKVNSNACVIGPNGCGKTHLLQAIGSFSQAIKQTDAISKAFQPYRLDNNSPKQPTEYEALLYNADEKEYLNYRFAVLAGKVVSESLFVKSASKNAKQTKVFEREGATISFAPQYKKHQQLLTGTINEGGLITNYAQGIKNAPIQFINEWANTVLLLNPSSINKHSKLAVAQIFNFIEKVHPNKNIELQNQALNNIADKARQLDLPLERIIANTAEEGGLQLSFKPKAFNDVNIILSFEEAREYFSEATFNTINLLMILEFFILGNLTLIIDEFDSSLHHKLSEAMIDLIRQSKREDNRSQVLMSTHNILLLDSGFRRDSIFVLKKDSEHATQITRADKFAVRKDAKLSLKYLNNEFGALPNIMSDQLHD